jgi:hypothetical protein
VKILDRKKPTPAKKPLKLRKQTIKELSDDALGAVGGGGGVGTGTANSIRVCM